ncbi:MAG: CBM9, partial [uncultured Gemmatimonadetes bacterium]
APPPGARRPRRPCRSRGGADHAGAEPAPEAGALRAGGGEDRGGGAGRGAERGGVERGGARHGFPAAGAQGGRARHAAHRGALHVRRRGALHRRADARHAGRGRGAHTAGPARPGGGGRLPGAGLRHLPRPLGAHRLPHQPLRREVRRGAGLAQRGPVVGPHLARGHPGRLGGVDGRAAHPLLAASLLARGQPDVGRAGLALRGAAQREEHVVVLGPLGGGRAAALRAPGGDPHRQASPRGGADAVRRGPRGVRAPHAARQPLPGGRGVRHPRGRRRADAAGLQPHPLGHHQPRLRAGGAGPGGGEPVRVRELLRREAPLLRGRERAPFLRRAQLLQLQQRGGDVALLLAAHRAGAAGRGARRVRLRGGAAQHAAAGRGQAHRPHGRRVAARRAGGGDGARGGPGAGGRRLARRGGGGAVQQLRHGPRAPHHRGRALHLGSDRHLGDPPLRRGRRPAARADRLARGDAGHGLEPVHGGAEVPADGELRPFQRAGRLAGHGPPAALQRALLRPPGPRERRQRHLLRPVRRVGHRDARLRRVRARLQGDGRLDVGDGAQLPQPGFRGERPGVHEPRGLRVDERQPAAPVDQAGVLVPPPHLDRRGPAAVQLRRRPHGPAGGHVPGRPVPQLLELGRVHPVPPRRVRRPRHPGRSGGAPPHGLVRLRQPEHRLPQAAGALAEPLVGRQRGGWALVQRQRQRAVQARHQRAAHGGPVVQHQPRHRAVRPPLRRPQRHRVLWPPRRVRRDRAAHPVAEHAPQLDLHPGPHAGAVRAALRGHGRLRRLQGVRAPPQRGEARVRRRAAHPHGGGRPRDLVHAGPGPRPGYPELHLRQPRLQRPLAARQRGAALGVPPRLHPVLRLAAGAQRLRPLRRLRLRPRRGRRLPVAPGQHLRDQGELLAGPI